VCPKPNTYKTHYSKISRRKETIIRRNLVIEDNEKIDSDKRRNEES
jgi:hypothetical protein